MGAQLQGKPRAFEGLDIHPFDPLGVVDTSDVVAEYFPGRHPGAWQSNDGTLSAVGDALKLVVSGPDPQFVMRTETTAGDICQVEAHFSRGTAEAEMFWAESSHDFSGTRRMTVPTREGPGGSSVAVFVMDRPERLGRLRFDPPEGHEHFLRRVTLRRCSLRPTEVWLPLIRQPYLVSLGGDARSSLVILPGVLHQWVIAPDPGVSVRVSVSSSGERAPEGVVFRGRSLDGRTKYFETVLDVAVGVWRDYSLPLALPPQSGPVVLSFEMTGGEGIGYVANPVLSGRASDPTRPDIVLISLDTSAARRFSLYGYPRKTSPHIDAHAKRGLLFSNAISAAAYTLPSHAAMLSGLSPLQTQAIRSSVPTEVPLVAQLLGREGYETVAITGGPLVSREWGFSRGFDRFADGLTTSLRRQVDEVLEELSTVRSSPLFVFLHSYAVHSPYQRSGSFSLPDCGRVGDQVAAAEVSSEVGVRQFKIWWIQPPDPSRLPAEDCVPDLYDDGIGAADVELGRLLTTIAKRSRPTAVIFTSDHGEMLGEAGRFLHGWDDAQVARVPLVIWAPGLKPGATSAMACGYDVAPTLLGLAGIEKPASMRGIDLLDRSVPQERSCASFALLPQPTLTLWRARSQASLALTVPRPQGEGRTDLDALAREVDAAFSGRQLQLDARDQILHVSASIPSGFMVCLTPGCGALNSTGGKGDFVLEPGARVSLGLVPGWTRRMKLEIEGRRFLIDLGQRLDRGFSVEGKTVAVHDGPEKQQTAVRLIWPGAETSRGPASTMTEQMKALGYVH
jgi:hypothetical protein